MLSNRQNELIRLIVEEYIREAKPISSNSLCKKLKCSSATIRNEMGILEDAGLIEKTHTSSGRVPSEKGYRYYVDNIMRPKELSGEDVLKLQTIFKNKSLVLTDAINKSMEIISEITNYTTIVLGNSSEENRISKVEAVPINDKQLIAIVVTDKGHVTNRNVMLQSNVSVDEIKQTVDLINKFLIGTPINKVNIALEYEVKPVIGKYVKQHEVLYNAFYNAFTEFTNDTTVRMNGTSNILKQPEFNDTKKIREMLDKFEDKEIISHIKEENNGVNIYIGSENEFDDDVTVIKTRYMINGEEGTIALIGPKRMEYDRVITLLNYIKDNIE